jgi:hypothetical protein
MKELPRINDPVFGAREQTRQLRSCDRNAGRGQFHTGGHWRCGIWSGFRRTGCAEDKVHGRKRWERSFDAQKRSGGGEVLRAPRVR